MSTMTITHNYHTHIGSYISQSLQCRAAALDVLYNLLHACAQCVYLDTVAVRESFNSRGSRTSAGFIGDNSGGVGNRSTSAGSQSTARYETTASHMGSPARPSAKGSYFFENESQSQGRDPSSTEDCANLATGSPGVGFNGYSNGNKGGDIGSSVLSPHERLAHEIVRGLLQVVSLSVTARLPSAAMGPASAYGHYSTTSNTAKSGSSTISGSSAGGSAGGSAKNEGEANNSRKEDIGASSGAEQCWAGLLESYRGGFALSFLSSHAHEIDGFGAAIGVLSTISVLCR